MGVTTLCTGHIQPWSRFWPLWIDWLLGDALGALVVAPVLLTILRRPSRPDSRERLETVIVVVGALLVAEVIFGASFAATIGSHPLEFVLFPFIIAAAVRLRQPAPSLVV